MQTPLEIEFRNFESSPALEEEIRQRAEKLDIGNEVFFDEEPGEEGPQATFVKEPLPYRRLTRTQGPRETSRRPMCGMAVA